MKVYLVVQKGAGISLLVVQRGARISLLCMGYLLQEGGGFTWQSRRVQEYHSSVWVTYCRKDGVPGGGEGYRNITHLYVG